MENLYDYNVKIDNAFSLSWNKKTAYAHPRNFYALSFRIKGNADYTHKDKHYHADKNDLVFVPENYDYVLSANTHEEIYVVHFYIDNLKLNDMSIFKPINPDIFENLFSEICEVCKLKRPGYKYTILSLFYKILEQMEIQQQKKTVKQSKLQEALNYMRENFQSVDLSVKSVANHIKTSEVYLRKMFKNNLHVSPLKYLTQLRLSKANEYLKSGYYSIEEITTLCGFNDSKYFSTVYKKETGVPPSKNLNKTLSSANNM